MSREVQSKIIMVSPVELKRIEIVDNSTYKDRKAFKLSKINMNSKESYELNQHLKRVNSMPDVYFVYQVKIYKRDFDGLFEDGMKLEIITARNSFFTTPLFAPESFGDINSMFFDHYIFKKEVIYKKEKLKTVLLKDIKLSKRKKVGVMKYFN